MAGLTYDMYTSGPNAGQVVQPVRYTLDDDDTTRIAVYERLATRLGSWRVNTKYGLDHFRMLDPQADDVERAELVNVEVLSVDRVVAILGETDITTSEDGLEKFAAVEFQTETGAALSITAQI